MPIVALTGASGFLGTHITEVLLARGVTVRGVVRNPDKAGWLWSRGVDLARADLADIGALADAFAGADAIVANAALSTRAPDVSHAAFEAANIAGVRNTLTAASIAKVARVVLISSVSVHRLARPYGNYTLDTPLLADDALWSASRITTNWSYARTKAAGERVAGKLAAEHGLDITIIRPGPIYGPRDHKLTAEWLTQLEGRVAFGLTGRFPHVHAGDVAAAVAGALANPRSGGKAYFTAGAPVSPYAILSILRDLTGSTARVLPIPLPFTLSFDDGPAIADLGFAPRDIRAGLADVVRSFDAG